MPWSFVLKAAKSALQQLLPLTISLSFSIYTYADNNIEGIQLYQKQLQPEHKEKLAADITRYRNADNLWDVLREDFTLSHYEENPAVQERIKWYMNNQDYLLRTAMRAAPYLYYILQQVKKRHLPAEVVLLPIIESGYNPFVTSNVGASGIWQMMPDTATGFGITQDRWYDGRRDIMASTRAALNYLAYLENFFDGNWLLSLAAYNTGEGNVLAAIKRNVRDGKSADFWSLPVAAQTRDYVPRLLALATIISHPDHYPVYLPPVRNAPYLAQINVGKQITLKLAAALAGISYTKMKQLNPGLKQLTTSKVGPYKLVLPIENIEQFTESLARSPLQQPLIFSRYKVKTGDSLIAIAKKFKTTPDDLRQLNNLSSNKIRHGMELILLKTTKDEPSAILTAKKKTTSNILIAKKKNSSDTMTALKTKVRYVLQPGDTIYMVRNRDTLQKIATRFNVSLQKLMAANQLTQEKITVGKHIIIPTHSTVKTGDTIYLVKRGDTVEKIAAKFHISPSAIRLINLVDNNSLNAGHKLIIPTHLLN